MSAAILRRITLISAALAKEGVPPLSPYWTREYRRFYRHGAARVLVECVGRGGDKSRSSVISAIAETLAGEFSIPRGERHYFTHISENVSEAAKTLSVLEQYLRILRVPFTRAGDTIELSAKPRGFKVLACRVGAVSGWRCFGWTSDECAKWSNDGSDPSEEVMASIAGMSITHPQARGRIISSPLSNEGYFAETFAKGEDGGQLVGTAPSWVANPSISEAHCRKIYPVARVFDREAAALFTAGGGGAFDADSVHAAFGREFDVTASGLPIIVIDASSGRKDSWTWGVARWVSSAGGLEHLKFELVDGIEGRFWKTISGDAIVSRLASVAKVWNCTQVHADQREALMLESAFQSRGLRYTVHNWTNASKIEAVETVRRWFADGRILLPDHDKLRKELLSFQEKISASGSFTFGARGSGHDDFVALLLTCAMAVGDMRSAASQREDPAAFGRMLLAREAAHEAADRGPGPWATNFTDSNGAPLGCVGSPPGVDHTSASYDGGAFEPLHGQSLSAYCASTIR